VYDSRYIDEDPVYGDVYSATNEPQYIRDRRLQERMNYANVAKIKESMSESKHAYNQIEKQTIEDLI
jgi:hypothetical protein